VGMSKERIRRLRELAALERADERPLIEDERFRAKIAAVEVELKALEMTQLRVVAAERNRKGNRPDPASSILKIKGSESQQTISELLLEAVSGRIEARTGLRMMPTFPRPSLSFRTAGFPQYGWKAGFPSGAFPDHQRLKPAPGIRCPSSSLHPPFVRLVAT